MLPERFPELFSEFIGLWIFVVATILPAFAYFERMQKGTPATDDVNNVMS